MKKYILSAIMFAAMAVTAGAQEVTFETSDFSKVGVWDQWENSPFNTTGTGSLSESDYSAVIDNPVTEGNSSEKVVKFVRSQYASNMVGARVDLNEADRFDITTTTKYVHAKVYKQTTGRVMCVLLGKRKDSALHQIALNTTEDQPSNTEQAWVLSSNTATTGTWTDMVFPVVGHGGIDVYSIVIIPECESTHSMTADETIYIDDVKVNSSSTPETATADYAICVASDATMSRTDRYTNVISVTQGSTSQYIHTTQQTDKKMYYDMTSSTVLDITKGTAVNVSLADADNATNVSDGMHKYVYIDYGNDGQFKWDGWNITTSSFSKPAESDLVSFTYYTNATSSIGSAKGYNSAGTQLTGSAGMTNTLPAFTIPETQADGIYRMRVKVDWCSIDPSAATQCNSGNNITSNGGIFVDVLANVHGSNANVTASSYNGNILINNKVLTTDATSVDFGKEYQIRIEPFVGFECSKIVVKHGYNLNGSQTVHGNQQWESVEYAASEFAEDGTFTLPASVMNGDVQIEGIFAEESTETVLKRVLANGLKVRFNNKSQTTKYIAVADGTVSGGNMTTADAATTSNNVWSFELVDGTTDKYYMKNELTQLYAAKTLAGETTILVNNDKTYAGQYSLSADGNYVKITCSNGSYTKDGVDANSLNCSDNKGIVAFKATGVDNNPRSYWTMSIVDSYTYDVTVGVANYATVCLPANIKVSEDDVIGIVTKADNVITATYQEAGSVIPANTGLLIKKYGNGTKTVTLTTTTETATTEQGILTGVVVATDIKSGDYVFANGAEGVGFYVVDAAATNKTLPAHRAYLKSGVAQGARQFIGFDETTDINVLNGRSATEETLGLSKKYIENNRVVIVKNGQKFNTAGQKIK